jgi:drug/metabolite transporter (DMT)-like permease
LCHDDRRCAGGIATLPGVILAAVGLALAAAALHGIWNVLVKVSGDPLRTFQRATVVGAVVMAVPALVGWLVTGRPGLNPAAVGFAALSATLEVAYLWLLSAAYARGELSVVYPIARGSAPLLSVMIGLIVLGERLGTLQLVGVFVLLAGILAVTLPQTSGRATLPALLTGVAIAVYTAIDRVGVRLTEPWIYGWILVTLMAIGMAISVRVAPLLRNMPRAPASGITWRQSAVIGVFMWVGYLLVLIALSIAPLAVVAPVRETAVVGVALWGVWRLGERRAAGLKIAGAAATLAGVSLLAI